MKKGDIVTIYQDPLTQEKFEGKAVLLEFLKDDYQMERWEVHFLEDSLDERYERWVKKER